MNTIDVSNNHGGYTRMTEAQFQKYFRPVKPVWEPTAYQVFLITVYLIQGHTIRGAMQKYRKTREYITYIWNKYAQK